MAPKPKARMKIEGYDENEIMGMLEKGNSLTWVAAELGTTRNSLKRWIDADVDRSARARDADLAGAEGADQMAEKVLLEAKADPIEIARARELASHYRWRAKIKDRARYGDKTEMTVKHDYAEMSDDELLQQYRALTSGQSAAVH